MSAVIDMLEYLVVNQLPLRGHNAGFASVLDENSAMGLFLSLFECTMRKDPELIRITKNNPTECTLYRPTDTKRDY